MKSIIITMMNSPTRLTTKIKGSVIFSIERDVFSRTHNFFCSWWLLIMFFRNRGWWPRKKWHGHHTLSFRRKPESSLFEGLWTPAFAGVTGFRTFYEAVKDSFSNYLRSATKAMSQWANTAITRTIFFWSAISTRHNHRAVFRKDQ